MVDGVLWVLWGIVLVALGTWLVGWLFARVMGERDYRDYYYRDGYVFLARWSPRILVGALLALPVVFVVGQILE